MDNKPLRKLFKLPLALTRRLWARDVSKAAGQGDDASGDAKQAMNSSTHNANVIPGIVSILFIVACFVVFWHFG